MTRRRGASSMTPVSPSLPPCPPAAAAAVQLLRVAPAADGDELLDSAPALQCEQRGAAAPTSHRQPLSCVASRPVLAPTLNAIHQSRVTLSPRPEHFKSSLLATARGNGGGLNSLAQNTVDSRSSRAGPSRDCTICMQSAGEGASLSPRACPCAQPACPPGQGTSPQCVVFLTAAAGFHVSAQEAALLLLLAETAVRNVRAKAPA